MAEWREFRAEREIGSGAEVFDRVAEGIATWGIQRGAGLRVTVRGRPAERVELGGEYVVRIGIGPFGVDAPVRVCEIVDDGGLNGQRAHDDVDGVVAAPESGLAESHVARRGFAYQTRDGHPEEGLEWFVVEHERATGRVTFVVTARARAASWYARLGGPVTRLLQDAFTTRYLDAAARLACETRR